MYQLTIVPICSYLQFSILGECKFKNVTVELLQINLHLFQNTFLELLAAVRELESRAGVNTEESLGDIRVVSVSNWPAHDLLLLVRDDLEVPLNSEISSLFGKLVYYT